LNACYTKAGEHWGEHVSMDRLFTLGQAAGYVKCCLPRELWPALPGSMPYYVIDLDVDTVVPSDQESPAWMISGELPE